MLNQASESVFTFFEHELPKKTGEDPRLTQVQMAIDILDFLHSSNKCYMAHAPAGIGKSYATLVPSIVYMKKKIGKVIYATHSLNLQAQLKCDELHELKSVGLVDSYIVAKGLTNYLCQRDTMYLDHDISDKILKIVKFLREGDRVEIEDKLGISIKNSIWDKISMKSNSQCECCGYMANCPSKEHREKFNNQGHEVLVTNHNQLIQSVINILEDKSPIIDYFSHKNVIVIDEAHLLEEAIISQLSYSITVDDLEECSGYVRTKRKQFQRAVQTLVAEIKKMTMQGEFKISKKAFEAIKQIDTQLHHEMAYDISRGQDSGKIIERVKDVTGRLLSPYYHRWFDPINKTFSAIEYNYRKRSQQIINELLKYNKLICISGTLAIDQSFEHLYFAWGGEPEKTQTRIYNTIFDYKKQVICYIPDQGIVPTPPQNIFDDEFKDFCYKQYLEIKELITITEGKTLILCTSHRQADFICDFLRDGCDITIYKQGEGSTEFLTQEFKNNKQSVLIGSGSFFSGVSIDSKSLVSVILCRLPFPTPDDPLFDLISKDLNDKDIFAKIQFPHMMTKLLQALGRLIRTKYDFGCFTILDPRALDSSYSDKIINELSSLGLTITRDREDVRKFLENKDEYFSIQYPKYSREKIHFPEKYLQNNEKHARIVV